LALAELRRRARVNEWGGENFEKRFGSPSQAKGILRGGDTGEVIDSEWLTQTAFAGVSVSADSPLGGEVHARN
jgi:hypothetical protein